MYRMKRIARFVLAGCAVLVFPLVAFSASPELFLADQPEVYLAIDKLDGLGQLPGLMTSDRGREAREVAREAGKVENVEDSFTEGMLQFIGMDGTPAMDIRPRAGFEYSRNGVAPPNSQGLQFPDGTGFRGGGFFR